MPLGMIEKVYKQAAQSQNAVYLLPARRTFVMATAIRRMFAVITASNVQNRMGSAIRSLPPPSTFLRVQAGPPGLSAWSG
jgi:hypothetical protein